MSKIVAKANGTIRCRISGACANQSRASTVTFTPDTAHLIEHGQHKFVAFVPESAESDGLVKKLCSGSIDLAVNEFRCPNTLSQVALHDKKVTVVVSQPRYGKVGPKLEALIVPAEPTK